MQTKRKPTPLRPAAALVFFLAAAVLCAQEPGIENTVGLTLKEVFAFYGIPDAVHTARGTEEWQDDVVFVYTEKKLDLYIYKDRVWQVSAPAALGVKKGDRKEAALRILADRVEDRGSYLLYNEEKSVWPKYARFNIDGDGRVGAIYIYRPDM
jgi:hypothetical protein